MGTKQKRLENKLKDYLRSPFTVQQAGYVPDPNNPKLTYGNTAIKTTLAFMFVDIRQSSTLHDEYGLEMACRIYKAFHEINVFYIEKFHGKVRAFDGDRVMAVFGMRGRSSHAVAAGFHIRRAVADFINGELQTPIEIGIGIDVGETMITKVGKGKDLNNIDLVWAGTSCNLASELSNWGVDQIYITEDVYQELRDTWIFDADGKNMWYDSEDRIDGFDAVEICYTDFHA